MSFIEEILKTKSILKLIQDKSKISSSEYIAQQLLSLSNTQVLG